MNFFRNCTLLLLTAVYSINVCGESTPLVIDGEETSLYVSFDDCVSFFGGYNVDYSEFTGVENTFENCNSIQLSGPGHIYRNNPVINTHSCTPGIDSSSTAMCISGLDNCEYVPGDDKSLLFDVKIIPGPSGIASIEKVSFYEQAPEEFVFSQGQSGTNDYPTKMAVRVLIDTLEIFVLEDVPTSRTWNLVELDFSNYPEFTVSDTTEFHFEILPYCLIGNGAPVQAWDIDELYIISSCNNVNAGFVKVIGDVNICDDSTSRVIYLETENALGPNFEWLLTDLNGNIILIPQGDSISFDTLDNGLYAVYNLAFGSEFSGGSVGGNINDFEGCFDLSSRVVVNNNKL